MNRPEHFRAHALDVDRWAADARREAERCAARHDDAGVALWLAKAATFEKSAEFWREAARTWRPEYAEQKQIRELSEERRKGPC